MRESAAGGTAGRTVPGQTTELAEEEEVKASPLAFREQWGCASSKRELGRGLWPRAKRALVWRSPKMGPGHLGDLLFFCLPV